MQRTIWEDAKLGMKSFTSYDRVAVVTDSTPIGRAVRAFGWLMPGEVRAYQLHDLLAATAWVTA